MKLLDLFSGGKSVTRVAESLGYTVTTLDMNKNYQPDIIADVLDFDYREAFKPGDFDVVWASPPCDTFSAARRPTYTIYSITMSNGSYRYIGMTTQNLQKRLAQHKADAKSGSCSLSTKLCQRRKPRDLQVLSVLTACSHG